MLRWMYWTWQTGLFFVLLFGAIAAIGITARFSPDHGRKGFLPISTTRGDRLFLGVVFGCVILLLWLAFFGTAFVSIGLLLAGIWFLVEFVWG